MDGQKSRPKTVRIGFRRGRLVRLPDGATCTIAGGVVRWVPPSPEEVELRAAALEWARLILADASKSLDMCGVLPSIGHQHRASERLLQAARAVEQAMRQATEHSQQSPLDIPANNPADISSDNVSDILLTNQIRPASV